MERSLSLIFTFSAHLLSQHVSVVESPHPHSFSILNISCSLCVTSTRISTTHHIILAAPDGSKHSETEIRLVSLDKDVLTYLATLAHLGA